MYKVEKNKITYCTISGIGYFRYDLPSSEKGRRKRFYESLKDCETEADRELCKDRLVEKVLQYIEDSKAPLPSASSTTFGALCQYYLWYIHIVSMNEKERIYSWLECMVDRNPNSNLGKMPVSGITQATIEEFLRSLVVTHSLQSIQQLWHFLKKVCEFGIKEKYIDAAALDLSTICVPTKEDMPENREHVSNLSEAELQILERECRRCNNDGAYHYGAAAQILLLIIYTGIHVTDACALKWENVSPDFKEITLANAGQSFELPRSIEILLRARRHLTPHQPDYVFSTVSGEPQSASSVEKTLKNIVMNAGLREGITTKTVYQSYSTLFRSALRQINDSLKFQIDSAPAPSEEVAAKLQAIIEEHPEVTGKLFVYANILLRELRL